MSAIKKVLSRKMFSQGGLLGPEKPKEPTGILASSEPLMKAAKFAKGGSGYVPGDALTYYGTPLMESYFPSVEQELARREGIAFDGVSRLGKLLGNVKPEAYDEIESTGIRYGTGSDAPRVAFKSTDRRTPLNLYRNFYQSPETPSLLENYVTSITDPDRRTVGQIRNDQIVDAVAEQMIGVRPSLTDLIEQGAKEYRIQVGTGKETDVSVPGVEKFITEYIASRDVYDAPTVSGTSPGSLQERIRLLQEAETETLPEELSEAALSKMSDEQKAQAFSDRVTEQRQVGLDAEQKRLEAEKNKREAEETALAQSLANRGPEATVMTGLSPETIREPDLAGQISPEVLGPKEFRESIGEGVYMRQDGVSKKILEAVEALENREDPEETKEKTKTALKNKLKEYTDEFKNAVSGFQGKTEFEKGMDFVSLGMSIAAGKDANAITNVANGIKENLSKFTEDAKQKRAFEKQVDLSAAKYGLENLKVDRANFEKLATEERALYKNLFVVSPGESIDYNGRQYSEGDTIVPSIGDLRDGTFPLDKVSSEAFSLENLKLQRATLTKDLDLLKALTISPNKFESGMQKYIDAASQVKGNIAIQDLITDSRELLVANKVTGGKAAAAALLQKAENFFGINIPGASKDPAKYRSQIAAAITANITALLNEGNRTISDADRKRAEDIGGLWADTITGGSTKDIDVVAAQLDRFEQSLERNSSNSISLMNGLERTWTGSLNPAQKDYGDVLRQARGELSAPSAARATEYNWQDIIQQGKDGSFTLKPNWREQE